MAEFEKWKNPPKANFVISKKLAGEGDEGAEVLYAAQDDICSSTHCLCMYNLLCCVPQVAVGALKMEHFSILLFIMF